MRLILLTILAATALLLALLKAGGRWPGTPPSPREQARAFLAAAGVDRSNASARRGPPLFTDIAPLVGITMIHDNGARGRFLLPEILGPGVGVLDYDEDGDLDIFLTDGGALDRSAAACRLYRNDGERFLEVAEAAGAAVPGHAFGVACADYDDDGHVDLFVTRAGSSVLLRNRGDGTFLDVSKSAGIDAPAEAVGASAVFFDADRDGDLDLYVAFYVLGTGVRETECFSPRGERDYCSPTAYPPSTDRLYRNLGDGRFEDVTEQSGIGAEAGNGLGVVASDFDGDGWPDLYVANDQTPAFLWHNRGDGTFENLAHLRGCAYDGSGVAIAGMGVACEDVNGDGEMDLFVTNIRNQSHLVLQNRGGQFVDAGSAMAIAGPTMAKTAFGVVLFDQDHDGQLDAMIANGDVTLGSPIIDPDNPYAQPDQFFRTVNGRFVEATEEAGVAFADAGRAVATADIDGDGDLDLLVTNNAGPVRLLRNENASGRSWLMVDARTGPGARAAIGAGVTVTAGEQRQVRQVRPQQSYLSSGDPRVHFGLGDASIVDELEIRWPDGSRTVRTQVPVNQVVRIEQDRGR